MKISHTFNKYFTDLSKTLKLKKIAPALKKTSVTSAETLKSPIYPKKAEAF